MASLRRIGQAFIVVYSITVCCELNTALGATGEPIAAAAEDDSSTTSQREEPTNIVYKKIRSGEAISVNFLNPVGELARTMFICYEHMDNIIEYLIGDLSGGVSLYTGSTIVVKLYIEHRIDQRPRFVQISCER